MKKKLLSVLAVTASLSAIALVGCGGDEHKHDYKWKSEGDKHWQVCACGEKTEKVDHFDEKVNATGKAGKDEICDACGANLHKHVYEEWKSTAAVHWQECKCGDKNSEGVAHEDVKNNETGAEGADEKCDACGRGYFAVTFNMDGHGTAPATQYVGADGFAAQPEAPADDDTYKFKGWYKDAKHETAFDFAAEKITAATEIYAWFEEDNTPGATKKYAYALTLDNANPQKAKKGEVVYYSYKALADGRYTISLGSGVNNENATFTTSLTGETKYGKDCAAGEITVDMRKNDTVYILFTFLGEEGNDVVVSPIVTEVVNEPLPDGKFLAGEYYNSTYTLVITDRAKQTLTFNDAQYTFRYIGGNFDRIYFVQSVANLGDITYYLSYDNGNYKFSNSQNTSGAATLEYFKPQDPVALSKILGYYEPVADVGGDEEGESTITPKPETDLDDPKGNANAKGGIIGLYLYDTTSKTAVTVRYKQKSSTTVTYSDLIDATYDTAKNRLTFGTFTATLKIAADGSVEGLVINDVTYVRKGDAGAVPPAKLNLLDNGVYTGAKYTIRAEYGSQYFGAEGYDGMTVLSLADGKYTVDVIGKDGDSVIYKITVSQDKKTVELYDESGKKIDTLKVFEWVINDLPTVAATDNVKADDFQKGLRLYKVAETGWYSFNVPAGAQAWRNLNENDYTNDEYVVVMANDTAVYLQKDELIAVYMATPAAVAVKVARAQAPVGTDASNPKALENGTATLDATDISKYYFTYTAPAAGTYLVGVVADGSVYLKYTVNGVEYGYGGVIEGWLGGMSGNNPYASIAVTADSLTLDIQVEGEIGWQSITVSVSEDYSADATDLTFAGTPEGNSLAVTAAAATGANYHIASTKGAVVTVTGSSAFTVKVQGGGIIEAEQSGDNYVAEIPAGKDVYFKLESATQQNVTLSQTFAKGSEGYPNEVTITDNKGTITVAKAVEGDEGIAPVFGYYSLSAGTYTIEATLVDDYAYVTLYLNGKIVNATDYTRLNDTVTINDGDVLCIEHTDIEEDLSVAITKLNFIFTEDQAGTYIGEFNDFGTLSKLILSFDRTGVGQITMGAMDPVSAIVTENPTGGYTLSYDGNTATFTLVNGVLSLTDATLADDPIAMTKPVLAVGTAQNPKSVVFTDDTATVEVPISSDDEVIEYYLQLPAGVYSIEDTSRGYNLVLKIVTDGEVVDNPSNPTGDTVSFVIYEGDLLVVVNYDYEEITITVVD